MSLYPNTIVLGAIANPSHDPPWQVMTGWFIGMMIVEIGFIFFAATSGQISGKRILTPPAVQATAVKKYHYPTFYILGGALMGDPAAGALGGSIGAWANSPDLLFTTVGAALGTLIGFGGIHVMLVLDGYWSRRGYFNEEPHSPRFLRKTVRAFASFVAMVAIPVACAGLALILSVAIFQPSLFHSIN